MRAALSHVALLVENIEATTSELLIPKEEIDEIDNFPGEGTRELYIGSSDRAARLLLMQPNGDGPYQKALAKRGPGLHHVALEVLDIEDYLSNLAGSGWHLHPKSLHLYREHRMAFLCRAGVPLLVELQQQKDLFVDNPYISQVQLTGVPKELVDALGCDSLSKAELTRICFADHGVMDV